MADKVKGKKSKAPAKKVGSRVKKSEASVETKTVESHLITKKPGRLKLGNDDVKSSETSAAELSNAMRPMPPLEEKFIQHQEASNETPTTGTIVPKTGMSTPFVKSEVEPDLLNVKLSRALMRKLKEQAMDEGISLEEFVTELLAESVVLRAWEIVERKNQMKGGGNSPGNARNPGPSGANNNANRGQRGNKGGGGGGGGGHRGGMNPLRYQSIMEDKATFLEYVRNQERKGR